MRVGDVKIIPYLALSFSQEQFKRMQINLIVKTDSYISDRKLKIYNFDKYLEVRPKDV